MIKPEFFDDPDIADISLAARLCFIGLWTQADRDGRLVDDPRRLKVRLFPYDDVDIADLLDELVAKGMIKSYRDDGKDYLWIPKFAKHQRPHPKEPPSVIPVPPVPLDSKTVAKHFEPCKNISDPSESGVLSLDSGTRNLDQQDKAAATPRPSDPRSEPPSENLRIITKLAHEAIDIEGIKASLSDLGDAVKSLCAIRVIAYNSEVVRKAVDSALAQRRRTA
jgi:hypothetical protein